MLSLLLLKITNNFKRDELEDDIASQHCRPLLLFLFSLFYGFDVFLLLLFKIINNYNQDELEEDIASQHCRPSLLFLFSLFYGLDVFVFVAFVQDHQQLQPG